MKTTYDTVQQELRRKPKRWLVTGAGGFIGSHLVEQLLKLEQQVVGLDNFITGHENNLRDVSVEVGSTLWKNFRFIEGDIQNAETCALACSGTDFVLHQAALGSVPRSLADPITSNAVNITGFLTMLVAARDAKVKRFVFASSSSIYGDNLSLPKREEQIGRPLSPYAVTKYVNELYADVFARCYDVPCIGLRYFNVFGPRQDPDGPYAAVIPKWLNALQSGVPVEINGDGETSRDFCYVANVVQANILAAAGTDCNALNRSFNIACGDQITLNELFGTLRDELCRLDPQLRPAKPKMNPFRAGDVRHSRADISAAKALLGYRPSHSFREGIVALLRYMASKHEMAAPVPQ